eukprot:TRINITY_DN3973_c0_g1_i1.p1 TRINITY_DN3973_c0_g1~~TRINITY_DN3973_c0_g1_i1.p1  ORF type:complete len:179 (+),score=31.33 TRINITY_DN3973_c0_g1_i1:75-611(+)
MAFSLLSAFAELVSAELASEEVREVKFSKEFLECVDEVASTPDVFLKGRKNSIEWTEQRTAHAIAISQMSEKLESLRYKFCPSKVTEDHFWFTYFTLLDDVLPSELRLQSPKILIENCTTESDDEGSISSNAVESTILTSVASSQVLEWMESPEWTCNTCLHHNNSLSIECEMCSACQ